MSTITSVSLIKDQKIDLTKGNPGLKKIVVAGGWNPAAKEGEEFDLDLFLLQLKDGKLQPEKAVVFFNNMTAPGILHHKDNRTGEGDGDDETIDVDLSAIGCDELIVCVNIFEAVQRGGQTFGRVQDAFIRLLNAETQEEICRFDLSEEGSQYNAFVLGRLYKKDGEWKYQALANGLNGDINEVAGTYA